MKNLMKSMLFISVLVLAVSFTQAQAGTSASETIIITEPYTRAVPPGQPNSAAFMLLENKTSTAHAIVNATSTVSKVVELHTHTHKDGMMQMRRIDKIDIPAQGSTVLQPGGLHIMLIGLHNDLSLDQKVSLTLEFEDGSKTTIEAPVRKIKM